MQVEQTEEDGTISADPLMRYGVMASGEIKRCRIGRLPLDGTVWAQVDTGDETAEVYRVTPGGEGVLSASGDVVLSGADFISERPAAVIIDRQQPQGVEDYGAVIVEYADGRKVEKAFAIAAGKRADVEVGR